MCWRLSCSTDSTIIFITLCLPLCRKSPTLHLPLLVTRSCHLLTISVFSSTCRARRITRFDRKDKRFQLFSDEPPVDAEYFETPFFDFLGKIKRIVREAHEGLIASAEVFYKQKVSERHCRHRSCREYSLLDATSVCAPFSMLALIIKVIIIILLVSSSLSYSSLFTGHTPDNEAALPAADYGVVCRGHHSKTTVLLQSVAGVPQ